jgi:hypothetical protein
MKVTRTRGYVLLLIGGALLGWALCEALLRIWTPEVLSDKKVRRSDPVLNHSLVPSSAYEFKNAEWDVEYRTNAEGFRDHEFPGERDSVFRIAVLGDSFAEGFGVALDSCFVKRLERSLNEASGRRKFAVMNFGLQGYSPLIEYVLLTTRVLQFRPDLVIQCYDMSDVKDDYLYGMLTEFDGRRRPMSVLPVKPTDFQNHVPLWWRIRAFFQSDSYLYSLAALALARRSTDPNPGAGIGRIEGVGGRHMMDSTDEYWGPWFAASQRYLRMTIDTLRATGIPYVLCTYPYGIQVGPAEWQEGRKVYGFGPGVYESAIFPSLNQFAREEQVPFLNMTLAFRKRSDGTLYYRYDPHWTPRGHAVAADTLLCFLRDQGLLP